MSLRYVGPVEVNVRVPKFSWAGEADALGNRAFEVSGLLAYEPAQQLLELTDNPDRRITVRGAAGVLEYLHYDTPALRANSGWCVLAPATLGAVDYTYNHIGSVPFSLSGLRAVGGQVVVAHSSRQLVNDFALVGEPVLVDPFRNEEADGSPDGMVVDVGGRAILREYDETSPMVWP